MYAGDADGLAALGLGAVDEYGGWDDHAADRAIRAVRAVRRRRW